jgi:S1-C subfamily serine protease
LAFRIVGGGLKLMALVVGLGLSVICVMSVVAIFTSSLWGQMIPALIVAAGLPLVVVERLAHAPVGERHAGLATDILATLWLGFPLLFVAGLAHMTQPLLAHEARLLEGAGETRAAWALAWLARIDHRPSATPPPEAPPQPVPQETAPTPQDLPEEEAPAQENEAPPESSPEEGPRPELSLAQLHDRVTPSLVTLAWHNGKRKPSATGFVVDHRGTTVTAAAVIADASHITARLADGTVEEMQVITVDSDRGMALLKPTNSLAALPLPLAQDGAPPEEEAMTVYVFGNPVGLESTLAQGQIISRERSWQGRPRLQLSAPLSPANYGGPVVNARGEVEALAIPAGDQYPQASALNVAVPASQIQAMLSDGADARPPETSSGPRPGSW